MNCLKCGADTKVCDSRMSNRVIGSVRRRRKCVKCDERYTTVEVVAEEWDRRESLLKRLEQVGSLFTGVIFPKFERRRAPNKKGKK